MGRRRRKTLRVVRRTLPKVFSCPKCGVVAVRITSQPDQSSQDRIITVACGNCGLNKPFKFPSEKAEIDVYNKFVDDFVAAGV